MNWWKAHHGIATDRKYAVILRRIRAVTESNALPSVTNIANTPCAITRSNILSVWVWLVDFSSQNAPRGSIDGIEIDEIATSLDLPDATVLVIIDAFRWRGMISGNLLSAFIKRNPFNDPTNAERQRRFKAKQKQSVTEGNALLTEDHELPLAREDGDGDGDGEVLVVTELLPSQKYYGRTDGNGAANGTLHANGNGRPSVIPLESKTEDMREVIHRYMSEDGKRKCKPPDDAIVGRCVSAIGNHPVIDAAVFLRELYVNNDQAPGRANGPRKYAWFVSVLSEQFGGHA